VDESSLTELTVTASTLLLVGLVEATVEATVAMVGVDTTGRTSSARWAAKAGAARPMVAIPAAVQISDFFMMVSPRDALSWYSARYEYVSQRTSRQYPRDIKGVGTGGRPLVLRRSRR